MRNLRAFLVLAGLAVLVGVVRLHTYDEPLERDLTTYAVIGHELNAGRALYSDLWDHKPPAIHVTYAGFERVFGYGPSAIYAMAVVAAIATMLGVYATTRALGGQEVTGTAAAAFWAIVCGDLALQANQPNTEVFINAAVVIGIALVATQKPSRRRLALGGLAFALASLYKPNAAAIAAAVAIARVIVARPDERRRALEDLVIIGAIGAAAWALVAGYFATTGRFAPFRDAVFTYNRAYGAELMVNLARGLQPKRLLPAAMQGVLPLAAITVIAATAAALRRIQPDRAAVLLLAAAAGTYAAVALPGHFYPHYYQLWLPPLAIATALGIASLSRWLTPSRRWTEPAAATTLAALLMALQAPSYRLDADAWSRAKYGDMFLQSREAARVLDQALEPEETFYELGSETGLYYESRRRPPSGVFYALPLLDGPLKDELTARVIADLERDPPEVFVVEISVDQDPTHPLVEWYREHYIPWQLPTKADRFLYHTRKDGRLYDEQIEMLKNIGPGLGYLSGS